MIPKNLTNAELGAFLQGVGRQMTAHDLLFAAALDGHGQDVMLAEIASRLELPWTQAYSRAAEILMLDVDDVVAIITGELEP